MRKRKHFKEKKKNNNKFIKIFLFNVYINCNNLFAVEYLDDTIE